MAVEIKLTSLPESVEEGTLMTWHKQPGESISEGETLAEVETDKIVLELPATVGGVVEKLHKRPGDTVARGELLATIDPAGTASAPAASPPESTAAPAPAPVEAPPPAPQAAPAPASAPVAAAAGNAGEDEAMSKLSPSARKLAQENGVAAAHLVGTGKNGRVTKADVLRHIDASQASPSKPAPAEGAAQAAQPQSPSGSSGTAPASAGAIRAGKRVPMSRLRARISERLVEAQQQSAILTTFNEVNMKAIMDARVQYRDSFEKKHGVKLGFMSYFVKAAVEALKEYPVLNASVEGSDIIYHDYYDVGIAVSSPRGLVVPVLRNADLLSFAAVEKGIRDLGLRARDGQLTMDDLTGGTFSITNGGIFGSMLSTPIINPPQAAILGMHSIVERPVAENGEVVIRPVMYLALSYDHRIIDGKEAVSFLVAIKNQLEDPSRLLLNL